MGNFHRFFRSIFSTMLVAVAAVSTAPAMAESNEVTIAYQSTPYPWLYAIETGAFEKATGYKIKWQEFDSGAKVATAMVSGDVQIGFVGSAPLAAASSRGVDLQLFWILGGITDGEALVVRNGSGIKTPQDLKGKKIGVPFASTTHYHTMFALQQWGIPAADVKILNMQPNQILAAWERGDIDAGYVWDPVLGSLKQSGKVLITSGDLSKKGKPTFNALVVDRKWGAAHADFMAKFVKVIADADAAYRNNPKAWTPDSPQIKAVAKMSGGDANEIAATMSQNFFPTLEQQASQQWLGGGKESRAGYSLKDTSEFLKTQHSIDTVKPDYSENVTARYVDAAAKLK
jgi:taurine transport system substrate-binding protein